MMNVITNNYQIESEFNELLSIVDRHYVSSMLEIGSLEGFTLHGFSGNQMDTMIVSIDLLVPESDPRRAIQQAGHDGQWRKMVENNNQFFLISGDSHSRYVIDCAKYFSPYDFIFVDADHSYDGVKADFENYSPMLAAGGIIAFHDIAENESGGGVFRLWEEVKGRYLHEEILHSPTKEKGIGVLYNIHG